MNIKAFVSFFSELLCIDDFNIKFKKNENCFDLDGNPVESFDFPRNEISLAYPEINIICINLDCAQGLVVIKAIAHEARHLFQYQAIYNSILREKTTGDVDQWESDFEAYRNGDYSNKIKSCELDAMAFADLIIESLFGLKAEETTDLKRLKIEIQQKNIDKAMNDDIKHFRIFVIQLNLINNII